MHDFKFQWGEGVFQSFAAVVVGGFEVALGVGALLEAQGFYAGDVESVDVVVFLQGLGEEDAETGVVDDGIPDSGADEVPQTLGYGDGEGAGLAEGAEAFVNPGGVVFKERPALVEDENLLLLGDVAEMFQQPDDEGGDEVFGEVFHVHIEETGVCRGRFQEEGGDFRKVEGDLRKVWLQRVEQLVVASNFVCPRLAS